jgi:hypothetical protein
MKPQNPLVYNRKPTKEEIKFGYGAQHYKEFTKEVYLKKDGSVKKRLKCPSDGLIYTR